PQCSAAGPLSCPSWARTRTLLIQSQTCCQLHQGAVASPLGAFGTHSAVGHRAPQKLSQDSPSSRHQQPRYWRRIPSVTIVLNARNRQRYQVLPPRLHAAARWAHVASALLVALACGGCRNAMRAIGATSALFEANTEQAFNGLAERYTQVTRDPRYDRA